MKKFKVILEAEIETVDAKETFEECSKLFLFTNNGVQLVVTKVTAVEEIKTVKGGNSG